MPTKRSIFQYARSLALSIFFASIPLSAASITFGAGSAVVSENRRATFDSVRTGTNLSAYTEDGLSITIGTVAYREFAVGSGYFSPGNGFVGGFHYPRGGHSTPTTIRGTDWSLISAVEFSLGTGFFNQWNRTGYVAWETRHEGQRSGSGWFLADLSLHAVVGIFDPAGFDQLHLANYPSLADVQLGLSRQVNALAIDNLRVQLWSPRQGDASPVPEPATLVLLGAGVFAVVVAQRVRR